LAYLRKGETFAEFAAGFGIGRTTAWRYVNEVVELLAARAPKLRQAVRDAKRAGHAYVILDGTLIPIDRLAADRPFYSGKHKMHGMNLQVIAGPSGEILWVSEALPGSVHDKKAEWIWGVPDELEKAGLVTLADKGDQGSTWGRSRTRAVRSRSRRRTPTALTRNSAHPARGQTPSSRHGRSSASSAAARGARRETRKSNSRTATTRGINQVRNSSRFPPMPVAPRNPMRHQPRGHPRNDRIISGQQAPRHQRRVLCL
jgi:hypothetical protein